MSRIDLQRWSHEFVNLIRTIYVYLGFGIEVWLIPFGINKFPVHIFKFNSFVETFTTYHKILLFE
jgi:hypothetical protein